jgi:hypothetical protein
MAKDPPLLPEVGREGVPPFGIEAQVSLTRSTSRSPLAEHIPVSLSGAHSAGPPFGSGGLPEVSLSGAHPYPEARGRRDAHHYLTLRGEGGAYVERRWGFLLRSPIPRPLVVEA